MNNRVVLITGSRKGIGFLLVKYFIDKGYKVIGCSRGESDYVHKDYYFNSPTSYYKITYYVM